MRLRSPRGVSGTLATVLVLTTVLVAAGGVLGDVTWYRDNWCHCDLDRCLEKVIDAVEENTTLPDCSPVYVAPPRSNSNNAGNSNSNSDDGTNSTTASPSNSTSDSDNSTTAESENSTTTVAPTTTGSSPSRRKRMVATEEEEEDVKKNEDVVVYPPVRAITAQSTSQGVMFDANYTAELCSCGEGSIVKMELCLLDFKYYDTLAKEDSNLYKGTNRRLFKPIHNALSNIKTEDGQIIFRRLNMKGYSKDENGFSKLHAEVEFVHRIDSPEYYVQMAIEAPYRFTRRIAGIKIDPFDCVVTEDITPLIPPVPNPYAWLMYVGIIAAAGILAGIVVLVCIGSRDAFYVRFW